MFTRKTQPAQSLALIAIALVGLIAITALAIDSGNVFGERRKAQSAADDAALAGALAFINSQNTTNAVHAITQAASNNYPDATVSIDLGAPFVGCDGNPVNITHIVTSADPTDSPNYYVQVMIRSNVKTYFGQVVGVRQLNYCVQAISRAKPFLRVPPFFGNAVVGLDPEGESYNDHSNATYWDITGGGVFANNDAADDHSNVTFHPAGVCATAVGNATGFTCAASSHNPQLFYKYPNSTDPSNMISPLMPPTPACDGTATRHADDGKIYTDADPSKNGSVWNGGFAGDYAPGLFCITDAGGNIHSAITGVGVTFFIQDTDFTMKFNGGGSIGASAPTSGDYKGVLMFSVFTDTPCTQNIEIRGNGSTPIVGTIFMPSACIDYRGNGTGDATDSMMIGYDVTSNGAGDVHLSYNPNNNWLYPQAPILELTR